MIRMTLDCVIPTQSSVIQIIHCNVNLKCFFQFYQNVCFLLSLFMHILLIFHKVVWRRIYGVVGSIIITLSQLSAECASKKIWKLVNNWRRYKQK